MMAGRRARIDLVLAEALASAPWMSDALCVEYDDVEFFIERGHHADPAKTVCSRCIVRHECLNYALEHGIEHGIWGGASPRERAELRRTGSPAGTQ
jgi:WhiB family redox-sensing transcriptional regulator